MAKGQGALIVTAHFGNWELGGAFIGPMLGFLPLLFVGLVPYLIPLGFLLGTVSGSGVATTVTLGSVAWPVLRRAGYPREQAGGMLTMLDDGVWEADTRLELEQLLPAYGLTLDSAGQKSQLQVSRNLSAEQKRLLRSLGYRD